MMICLDLYVVILVLGGMIENMSFKLVVTIGFKKVSYKKVNKKTKISRKWSPRAAEVKRLETD